jgi:hypothetical protein
MSTSASFHVVLNALAHGELQPDHVLLFVTEIKLELRFTPQPVASPVRSN